MVEGTMSYVITEVDGVVSSGLLHYLNSLNPGFPPLHDKHLRHGYWWVAQEIKSTSFVGFAGMVPMAPFEDVGYMKRAFVVPAHRGHGLQCRFMVAREAKASEIGWTMLVGECDGDNHASARSFEKRGFTRCEPEQPWEKKGSIYFAKLLT